MIATQINEGGALAAAASTLTVTWGQDTVDGACLLIAVACYGGSDVAIGVPSGSGLWTRVGSQVDRLTNCSVTIFKRENAGVVSSGTVETVDLTATADGSALPEFAEIFSLEYGVGYTTNVNKTNSGSSQTIDTGSVASLTDNEIAVGIAANANAPLATDQGANTTGFTQLAEQHSTSAGTTHNTAGIYEKQLGSTGASAQLTVPLTGGISRAWCVQLVTLKAAINPPPGTDDGKLHQMIYLQEGPNLSSDADAQAIIAMPGIEHVVGQIGLPGTSDKFNGRADTLFNAGIDSFPYIKGTAYQPSSGSNPLGFPESWFAHSVKTSDPSYGSGTRVLAFGSSVYQMQPGTTGSWTDSTGFLGVVGAVYTGFNAFRAREAVYAIEKMEAQYGAGFQAGGVWLDSLGSDEIHGQVNPSTGTAYTWTTWKPLVEALMDTVAAAVAAKGSQYKFYCNGIGTHPEIADHSDGGLIENWVLNDATPPVIASSTATEANVNSDVQDALDAQIAGAGFQALCTNDTGNPPMTDAEHVKWIRFTVALYYLSNRGKAHYTYDAGSTGVWAQTWVNNNAFTQDLGLPLETENTASAYRKSALTGGGYVYGRQYEKGYAIVNTSSTTAITVTLPRDDYTDLDGNSIPQSYSVPARSGMLLIAPTAEGGSGTPTTIDAEWSGMTVTVTTAGTRVQGPNYACSGVVIIADPANSGNGRYGGATISGPAPAQGFKLAPGQVSPRMSVTNLNKLYFDSASSGDKFFLSIIA